MPQKKSINKQTDRNEQLMREYINVIRHAPILVQPEYHSSNLKQPSLLEEVDSFTTYGISATVKD
ncbi:MAG TPA: hypothetical protein VNC84_07740 [Gammaproteobacteria bacterium]|jgi:hypothetical protein|nr:hypothetical protein [Gammaproteobacteria bacterium]